MICQACLLCPTTPPAGRDRLGLKADSPEVVAESREDNNTAEVAVVVRP